MRVSGKGTGDGRLAEVVSDVQIPLDNLAWTIEAYLMENGTRLDTETRFLLAGIRDCADLVAGRIRFMARQEAPAARATAPAAPVEFRRETAA